MDELKKFRSLLGSVVKVQLESKATNDSTSKVFPIKRSRKEDQSAIQKESFLPIPSSIIGNQWEQEMLTKYQDLFQFPFDATINDHTMILLVLAYQMNALRSWCEVGDGALAKYVPYFMEKSGNLIDWSKHLLLFDPNIAKKQLDSFQKLLYKAANRYPLTGIYIKKKWMPIFFTKVPLNIWFYRISSFPLFSYTDCRIKHHRTLRIVFIKTSYGPYGSYWHDL